MLVLELVWAQTEGTEQAWVLAAEPSLVLCSGGALASAPVLLLGGGAQE